MATAQANREALFERIERCYPDLPAKVGSEALFEVVNSVAEFHAECSEFDTSYTSVMMTDVFARLHGAEEEAV